MSTLSLFDGPTEMHALCRVFDWASTPIGAPDNWPSELRTTVRLMLGSGIPACILWGPAYVQVYNDAMARVFGGKHPGALGKPSQEVWPEGWGQNEPMFARVMAGETVFIENAPYESHRHGRTESMHITASFSPVMLEDGTVGGVYSNLVETTDVVAQRRLEREHVELIAHLEAERASSSAVLESMRDHYFTLDADFRFRTLNRSMRELLAERAADFIGRTHWEMFPASLGTPVEHGYRRVMTERIDVHFTHHYVGDGVDTYVEADAYPTQDGGIAVFWRDVSSHVAAERALAASEALFRTVQDASPHGSTLYRPLRDDTGAIVDFEFVYVNTVGAKMSGSTQETLMGARLLDVFPHAVPNGAFERYVRVVESREPMEWEARDMRDGVDLGVHFIIVPVGDLLHVRFADITERMRLAAERESLLETSHAAYAEARTAEARLRDVFEQAPMAIAVMMGPEHVYTIVSPKYAETPGAGRQLLGRSVREAFPEVTTTDFFDIIDRVYTTGVPYHAFERRVMLDDNQDGVLVEHFFNIGYQPLRNAKGVVYAIASVAYDITEQIRARREVEQARETAEAARAEAEGANKAKGEFLAVMSHELRTPLNAIGGYAELLELGVHGPVTDAQRTALSRIQASQRHLLGLINGVLNYSRVEAGAVTYDITTIPMQEAVAEAESLVAPQVRAKGLHFVWEGCPKELTVLADREKLQQILLNLLSNSIKFTDARGGEAGTVEVTCERAGDRVLVHVRDTGEGIEPDKLRSVFEPFVQIDQRLTRRQEGVGLGLTISRDLARGMGGDLTAASVPDEGSVFTLSLPRGKRD